ncbi:histidine phosphatase family protein [uncultured Sphingomonas sp.]|uniref:histidine phosphatase family protein n=1 Tax=uncultured Sphingomonas sp. TaxID=158754 RepID=UPI0035CB084C
MAATLILVRHAAHVHLDGTLSGRMPGVPLSDEGRAQAARLAARLAAQGVDAVQTSPLDRAQATATAIADAAGLTVGTSDGLQEIDFGAWTGRRFDALASDPVWDAWNAHRATARPPGGEGMVEAQARIVAYLDATAREHDGGTVVLVSHADMIRAAVCHVLGLELDNLLRFDIDPASATTLSWGDGWARVNILNDRGIDGVCGIA